MNRPSLFVIAGGGILVALLLVGLLVTSGGGASATRSAQGIMAAPAKVDTAEANAWAEARAANAEGAYRTYLAAYPQGAFSVEANQALQRLSLEAAAEKAKPAEPKPVVTKVAERPAHVTAHRSQSSIREACGRYVNDMLPPPSKTGRTLGGAAVGCALGAAVAGGNDARNCAIGAVAGGATGYVSGSSRENRRARIYNECVAHGGPPR